MRLKLQMPGINTKDVFAVHGGKVITFVPDALMNGVGPSHEVQILDVANWFGLLSCCTTQEYREQMT